MERIIGRYTGKKKGPLLICLGGMHGNEYAGIEALNTMFMMLKNEPVVNPDFSYSGRLLGLRGNIQAIKENKRFIEKDLNRQWTKENIKRIKNTDIKNLRFEDLELRELLEVIEAEIVDYKPEKIVLLDFHTSSAYGGIFAIATYDPDSLKIAMDMHAPVITGMLKGIEGTTMHYFKDENFNVRTVSIVFEAGQHTEELSVNRSIAALTNCMRTIGAVKAEDVENRHDRLLINYSKGLPKVADLISTYKIHPDDKFEMIPNYENFQPVKKGEILAYHNKKEVPAPKDGLILMPLYQKQGEDGFFIVKKSDY